MAQVSIAPLAGLTSGRRVFATPLARRLARDHGLDLARLGGSGPRGRIVERDIRGALARQAAPPLHAALLVEPASSAPPPVPASSQFQIDCEIDALQALRAELNAARPAGARLSLFDWLVRAAAVAARRVPAFAGEADTVDLGLVFADAADGRLAVLRAADTKPLSVIHAEIRDLAGGARGEPAVIDRVGGLLALANPGREGIRHASLALPPACFAMCTFGAADQRLRLARGTVVETQAISLTLSVDGRRIGMAAATDWLKTVRSLVEVPLSMLV